MMNAMDMSIASIVQTLKDTGQYENTIIVFTSDVSDKIWQMIRFIEKCDVIVF